MLTRWHDPADPIEQAIIHQSGGEVKAFPDESTAEEPGPARVFIAGDWTSGLAVAKAFGDFVGKRHGLGYYYRYERTSEICEKESRRLAG